jgi:hypothetical protein
MIDKYNLFRISSHLISILNYCVTNQCRPKIKFLDNEGKVLKKKNYYLFENNNFHKKLITIVYRKKQFSPYKPILYS